MHDSLLCVASSLCKGREPKCSIYFLCEDICFSCQKEVMAKKGYQIIIHKIYKPGIFTMHNMFVVSLAKRSQTILLSLCDELLVKLETAICLRDIMSSSNHIICLSGAPMSIASFL